MRFLKLVAATGLALSIEGLSGAAGVSVIQSQALAADYEVKTVCAEYSGTGKKYKVDAQIMKGDELNRRVGGFRFSSFSKYVIIFWGDDQASIIELDYSYGPSVFGSDGTDQQGARWSVSTSSYCW